MRRDRRFWEDEHGDGVSAGWVIAGITIVLLVVSVLSYWVNDMYRFHYGLFDTH